MYVSNVLDTCFWLMSVILSHFKLPGATFTYIQGRIMLEWRTTSLHNCSPSAIYSPAETAARPSLYVESSWESRGFMSFAPFKKSYFNLNCPIILFFIALTHLK